MKTDDLVTMLATGIEATDVRAVEKRIGKAFLVGLAGTLIIFYVRYGVRDDLGEAMTLPAFWFKFGFALSVAAAAAWTMLRLSRPGLRAASGWIGAAAVVGLVWIIGAIGLAQALPGQRLPLLLGHSWRICSFNIALLSVPLFIGLLYALRGLAPTRPAQAGAAAGLLAGAISLFVYSWYCTEMAVQFWGVWYLIGMLVPCAAGALVGRAFLRW